MGIWTEDKIPGIPLQAELTDTALVFNNSAYQAADHYSVKNPVLYLFQNASLQVIKQRDSVYLAGNVTLWSVTRNEPEKPVFISLVKTDVIKQDDIQNSQQTDKAPLKEPLLISEFIVYPNPFENSFQVSFSLEQRGNVSFSVVDLLGKVVFNGNKGVLDAGKHTLNLQPQLSVGIYILKLNYNGKQKSTMIIKQ